MEERLESFGNKFMIRDVEEAVFIRISRGGLESTSGVAKYIVKVVLPAA